MKKLSIIIPVFGVFNNDNPVFFDALLASMKRAFSAYEDSFEIIVVNDDKANVHSDAVHSVFDRHGLLGHLVYLENETNQGQANSRNRGAAAARYDYLMFIDQDDYVSDNFFTEFVSEKASADLFILRPYFDITGRGVTKAYTPLLYFQYSSGHRLKHLWSLLASNVAYSPGQVIMRKQCFERAGGFSVLKNKGSDDYALFYKMVFGSDLSYAFLKDAAFYYRVHPLQSSRQCDMQSSVSEFLQTVSPCSCREKMIHSIKLNVNLSFLNKLFYVLFFKRARV